SAFDSVADALNSLKLGKPYKPLVFTKTKPHVGVIIVPPNGEGTGRMLEDLCLASVQDDPAIACVNTYYECLQQVGINLPTKEIPKGWVHTFLASREKNAAL